MRYWWLGIFLATGVGAALRLADIGGHSFWYDEAYSARIADEATTWEMWTGARRDNGNPPGYYIAHKWFAAIFGKSEAGQRTLAALCGVLTIPLIALLCRRLTLLCPLAPAAGERGRAHQRGLTASSNPRFQLMTIPTR
jgi:4-amino-4-deoxy-L-arabinose transferase-like glycosyltransferase